MIADPLRIAWLEGCEDNVACSGERHRMVMGTEFLNDHDSCISPAAHFGPNCEALLYPPDEVTRAGPTRLAEMIATPGSNVRLNRPRQAIQVYGCGGGIVAHIPIRLLGAEESLGTD